MLEVGQLGTAMLGAQFCDDCGPESRITHTCIAAI